MYMLWLLLLLSVNRVVLDGPEYLDDSFENNQNLLLKNERDYATMHEIKCTHNINAPFSKYNKADYDTKTEEFQHCNLDELETNFRNNLQNPYHTVLYPYEYFPKVILLFQFLKDSQFITQQIPFLKSVLNSYYGQLEGFVTDAKASKRAHRDLENANSKMREDIKQAKYSAESVEEGKAEIEMILESIKTANDVCSGNARNDINIYKNIISTRDIKEELDFIFSDLQSGFSEIKKVCREATSVPTLDPVVTATIKKHNEIVKKLQKVESDIETKLKSVKVEKSKYFEWLTKIHEKLPRYHELVINDIRHSLQSTQNTFGEIDQLMKELETLIKKVTSELPQQVSDSSELIQLTISSIQNHIKAYDNLRTSMDNFRTFYTQLEDDVKILISRNGIIKEEVTSSYENFGIAIMVLDEFISIIEDSDISRELVLSALKKHSGRPNNDFTSINSSNVEGYLTLLDSINTRTDKARSDIVRIGWNASKYLNDLNPHKKKLEKQFDSIKLKKPRERIIIKGPPIDDLERPTKGTTTVLTQNKTPKSDQPPSQEDKDIKINPREDVKSIPVVKKQPRETIVIEGPPIDDLERPTKNTTTVLTQNKTPKSDQPPPQEDKDIKINPREDMKTIPVVSKQPSPGPSENKENNTKVSDANKMNPTSIAVIACGAIVAVIILVAVVATLFYKRKWKLLAQVPISSKRSTI